MFALIVASSTGASAQDAGVLPNAVAPLTIPTPDGSGQVTEPSIVQFSPPWRGFTYWMVVAPYPHSDAEDENPSIFVSDDGRHWSLPPGGTNPIQKPTPPFSFGRFKSFLRPHFRPALALLHLRRPISLY